MASQNISSKYAGAEESKKSQQNYSQGFNN